MIILPVRAFLWYKSNMLMGLGRIERATDRGGSSAENTPAVLDVEAEAQRIQIRSVELRLEEIVRVIKDYPSCPRSEISVEELQKKLRAGTPRYTTRTKPLRPANLTDGVAVLYVTDDVSKDHAHTLIIPDEGDAEYERRSFNADPQFIREAPVALRGLENLAADIGAVQSLQFCLGGLAVERAYEWKNALILKPSQQPSA
jgi:hypothetical protein